MAWQQALSQLDQGGIVEFGIHQMNEKTGCPKWRRHKGGPSFRFQSVRSALFSPTKGARAACLGRSTYATSRYSASSGSVVPYVATWLQGVDLAFLARAAAAEPEVTLVPSRSLDMIRGDNHATLLIYLAHMFGEGAQMYGVRVLASGSIELP